jgi:hypothetical protein
VIRTAVLALLVVGLLELYSLLPTRQPPKPAPAESSWRQLRGVFHLAPADFPDVATQRRLLAKAEALELDFLVVVAPPEWKPPEPFPDDGALSVWIEPEFVTKAGHLVALTEKDAIGSRKADVDRWLLSESPTSSSDTSPKPVFVALHPDDLRNGWRSLDRFPAAIEVINLESQRQRWLADAPLRTFFSVAFGVLNEFVGTMRDGPYLPKNFLALDTPRPDGKFPVGLLGHRAHGDIPWADEERLPWPRPETTLAFGRTIAFYRSPTAVAPGERRRAFTRAVAEGRIAMHFPAVFPFRGNEWVLECDGERYFVGDVASIADPKRCAFRVETPEGFPYPVRLRLFRNGTLAKEERDVQRLRRFALPGPGQYRLEVWAEPASLFRLVVEAPVPYVFYNALAVR